MWQHMFSMPVTCTVWSSQKIQYPVFYHSDITLSNKNIFSLLSFRNLRSKVSERTQCFYNLHINFHSFQSMFFLKLKEDQASKLENPGTPKQTKFYVMYHKVSHYPLTQVARFRSQVNPYDTFRGKFVTQPGITPRRTEAPVSIITTKLHTQSLVCHKRC